MDIECKHADCKDCVRAVGFIPGGETGKFYLIYVDSEGNFRKREISKIKNGAWTCIGKTDVIDICPNYTVTHIDGIEI